MFPQDYSDFEPLALAAFNSWAPGAKITYKTLQPGFSGAAVMRVDVRESRQSQVDNGQYILKLAQRSEWRTFESELEGHNNTYKVNEQFSSFHIPTLIRSLDLPDLNGYALLSEIAGASLDAFTSIDGPERPEFRLICQQLISDLLNSWSINDSIQDCKPSHILEAWLGYRLKPDKQPSLHTYVKKMAGTDIVWNEAGEVLINPLSFYNLPQDFSLSELSVVNSWLHHDLHGGNLLVHRVQPIDKPYQIIDLGQSRRGPLGFDEAYLEIAEIVYSLGGNDPTQLVNLLKCLDIPGSPSMLPSHTSWLYECLKIMRASFAEWRDRVHPRRTDDLNRQVRLAQVAAGLNWAGKPLPDNHRYLALCYAGWAAREYLRLYEPVAWNSLWPHHRTRRAESSRSSANEADYALWEELWQSVQGFSATAGKFILVAEAQRETEEHPYLSALGQLPWSAIIDLDPASDLLGLHRCAAPVIQGNRGLHTFDQRLPTVDYQYGTAWMMAAGWELKGEPATDYENWIFDKLHVVRTFARHIETKTSPDPIYVVVLPGAGLDTGHPLGRVAQVLQALYETTRGRAKVILLGSQEVGVAFKHIHIPLDPKMFVQLVAQTFGQRPRGGDVTIPGTDDTGITERKIPIQDLRTLQENLEVLHSNILTDIETRLGGDGATFWRGAPPSWADLQQGLDIPRTIHRELVDRLHAALDEPRNRTIVLYHHPGAGATTVAYRAAWDLHQQYPTCILTRWSDGLSSRLQMLYRLAQRPILLVAESPVLTETQREDLHRDLSQNNTPVILLYLRRGFQHNDDYPFKLEDPMSPAEAQVFFERYKGLIDDPQRITELERITCDETLARYRTPFFYGLITHERQFMAVDRYVHTHIHGIRGKVRELLEYIALVTIYSNTGLPDTLVKLLLGLPESAKVSPLEIFGDGPARLISVRQGRIRLMHQVIAEEVLSDLVGGGKDEWQFELHHLAIDLIRDVVSVVDPDSQMVHDLFRQIFIERLGGEGDEFDDRRSFSPLIERIDQIDKSLGHRVLTILRDSCPNGSHFWNHLGRHQVYRMRHDFEKAEEYLRRAIELAADDYLHYHTLGVVLRSRIRETIQSMRDSSATDLLDAIASDFNAAVEAFEQSRQLSPENIYGYITHTQMILEVAAGFKRLLNAKNIGQISSSERRVQEWIAENIPVAHKLLNDADQLYGTLNQTDKYLIECYADLQRLYGDIDQVISIWEIADARGNNSATGRRALANAYVARQESHWSRMQQSELRRIAELMELNIHSSGRRDEDYRLWFEAYKLLPEFDIEEALGKLRLWINYFPSWRAYYYVYVLQFYLWYSGRSESIDEMENALEECQKRLVGRKSYSALWLGLRPNYCPLVSASELGEWNKRLNFWSDTNQLRRINGVIDDPIMSVQTGWILLDGKVRAFFVPAAGSFSPHLDENRPVSFFLGFSPTGLRAWDVKSGHLPGQDRVRPGKSSVGLVASIPAGPTVSDTEKRKQVKKLRQERVMTFIDDVLRAKAQIEADITLDELEQRLEAAFGVDGIVAAMGANSLRSLLEGLPDYKMARDGNITIIRLTGTPPPRQRTYVEIRTGKIVYFNIAKDYGFIDDGSKEQYYFRRSHIVTEFRNHSLHAGLIVEFVPDIGPNGPIAIKIRFVDASAVSVLEGDELAQQVEARVREVLNDALIAGQVVTYADLCQLLFDAFPGKPKLTDRLGVASVAVYLNTLAGIQIVGERPDLYVQLKDKRVFGRLSPKVNQEIPAPQQKDYLRSQVNSFVIQVLSQGERDGVSVELTRLGDLLKARFPGEPVYKRLGYKKLSEFIKSQDNLSIQKEGVQECVTYQGPPSRSTTINAAVVSTPDYPSSVPQQLREDVRDFINVQLAAASQAGRSLDVPNLGSMLLVQFPGERVYKRLGFKQLHKLLLSYGEFKIDLLDGNHVITYAGETSAGPSETLNAGKADAEASPTEGVPSSVVDDLAELRKGVEVFVLELVIQAGPSGLGLESIGAQLVAQFPGERVYKRLGFKKLVDLLNTFSVVTILQPSGRVVAADSV